MGLSGSINKGVSGVYVITNTINDMKYIGCSNDIYRRMYEHRKPSRAPVSALSRAIQKLDVENFNLTVLEIGKDMFDREVYWIKELKTREPNGYNETDGGIGANGVNVSEETRRKLGVHSKGVIVWTQPVHMLDKNTNEIIMSFISMADAVRWLNKNTKYKTTKGIGVTSVCTGKEKTAYGYKWEYNGGRVMSSKFRKKVKDARKKSPHSNRRKTNMIDIETNKVIRSFESIANAIKWVKENKTYKYVGAKPIKRSDRNGSIAYGYKWEIGKAYEYGK